MKNQELCGYCEESFLQDSVKDAFQYSNEYCIHEHNVLHTNASVNTISHCLKETRQTFYEL